MFCKTPLAGVDVTARGCLRFAVRRPEWPQSRVAGSKDSALQPASGLLRSPT
jgi:hypothetical protein